MMIKIAIERTDPLVGTAAAGRREPVPFVGWLDLLRAISELVGAEGCAVDQTCTSQQNGTAEHALAETAKGDLTPS
jgi:hypothetical protein